MSIQSEIDRIEQNVADTYSVLAGAGAPMPASMDSDNLAGTAANIAAVLYNGPQNLTTDQQAQARDNIGVKSAYELAKESGYDGSEQQFGYKIAISVITPEMYGAKGDGVTDDSVAIQAAINAAYNSQVEGNNGTKITPIVYLAAKNYKISTGLVFEKRNAQFKCEGAISYDGTDSAIVIKNSQCNIYIDSVYAPNGTALLVTSVEHQVVTNNITINRIDGSITGIHLLENSSLQPNHCISYNKIRVYTINASGTGVLLQENGITWLTENWFFLGSIGGGASVGIKIETISGEYGAGGNRFFHGGLEGLDSNGCGIYLYNTSGNTFEDFRTAENHGSSLIKFVGECSNNDIATSTIPLGGVDISEMTAGFGNYLRGDIATGLPYLGGYNAGDSALVTYSGGITYNPIFANISAEVNLTNFPNNIIKQIVNNGVVIPTTISFNDLTEIEEYTLGGVYSDNSSMARGFPLAIEVDNVSRFKLYDNKGSLVLDNSNGLYFNKFLSIKWVGYEKNSNINIWDIKIFGSQYEETINKITKLSQSSTDIQYPSAKAVYDEIYKLKAYGPNLSLDNEGHLIFVSSAEFTNLVPVSKNSDGTVYNNGLGYKTGYRLSSSGGETETAGSVITGFMPCNNESETFFIKGLSWTGIVGGYSINGYILFYDSNYNMIGGYNAAGSEIGKLLTAEVISNNDNGLIAITPTFETQVDLAYFRFSGVDINYTQSAGYTTVPVATVDEDITDVLEQDLGRIATLNQGNYSADKAYEWNDVVTFENASYWHISKNNTVGISPEDSSVWTIIGITQNTLSGVTSVNGKTGVVKLTADDVGALSSSEYTTKILTVTYEDGTSDTIDLVVKTS